MTKKKTPQTIEECNAELELTQKKIRQYENRSKMLDRRLAIEKRKARNHRLCSRGGFIERTNGIRCSWKPCKEKATSNICLMFFCTAQPKKRRLWLPSKEKR